MALTRFVPILFIIALVVYWMWKSPSDVFARHPLCFLWLLGIGASKMMTGVMVSHICDDELHPFSRTIASLSILLVHICLMRFTAFHAHIPEYVFAKGQASRPDTFWIPYDNQMTTSGCHPWKPDETPWPHPDQACGHWVWMEDLILLEALTLMVVSYAHFAVSITQEICSILGIHCFRITPRPVEPALPVEPDTVITAHGRQPQRDASPRRRPPAGAGRMKQIH